MFLQFDRQIDAGLIFFKSQLIVLFMKHTDNLICNFYVFTVVLKNKFLSTKKKHIQTLRGQQNDSTSEHCKPNFVTSDSNRVTMNLHIPGGSS